MYDYDRQLSQPVAAVCCSGYYLVPSVNIRTYLLIVDQVFGKCYASTDTCIWGVSNISYVTF